MTKTKSELEPVSTEDIMGEFLDRFDAACVYAVRRTDINGDEYYHKFKGTRATGIGLSNMMIDRLKEDMGSWVEEGDNGED